MAEQAQEKTEEPTPHRLREAREKGQIAKSKEITTAVLLLASYYVFKYAAQYMWSNLVTSMQSILELIPAAKSEFSFQFVGTLFFYGFRGFAAAVTPIFAVAIVAALVVEALQTGFVFSLDPLTPKLEKLNPAEGLKKMFSLQGIVELIKSIVKIVIIFWIASRVIISELPKIILLIDLAPWDSLALGGSIAYTIAMRVGLFYIAIAILDYFYRRWEYMKNLKMSRQEIKEEYKRLEGDPLVKQRIREMQRAAAQQRMMSAVPKADVVVTNPTHLAVALEYTSPLMKSPHVTAKGELLIAEKIKQIAEAHNVPVVENEPLARSLFKTTPVGKEIPFELYKAVAEVLAFVYKIKKRKRKRSPEAGK